MLEITLFLLLGSLSGFIAGMFGVGGGLIIVPALLYLLKAETDYAYLMHTAIATSLAIIIFTSISSFYAHNKNNMIIWPVFFKILPTILIGSYIGAILTKYMSFDFLRNLFAIFEIIVAIIIWFNISAKEKMKHIYNWIFLIAGFVIGFLSSIIGIGGGTIATPFFIYNNINVKNAIAISATLGIPIAIAASIGFIIISSDVYIHQDNFGYINLKAFIAISLTSILFAPLGAKVSYIINNTKLRKLFAILLLFLGFRIMLF